MGTPSGTDADGGDDMNESLNLYIDEWCHWLGVRRDQGPNRRLALVAGVFGPMIAATFLMASILTIGFVTEGFRDDIAQEATEARIKAFAIEAADVSSNSLRAEIRASEGLLRDDIAALRHDLFKNSEASTLQDMSNADLLAIMNEAMDELLVRDLALKAIREDTEKEGDQ